MTDYSELVEALRCELHYTSCPVSDCKYICHDTFCDTYRLMVDAAAAIEELQDKVVELEEELNDADVAADDNGRQIEELQAEVKILKVSGREAYFEGLAAEPERGRWIRKDAELYYWHECSKCGERPLYDRYANKVLSAYCPRCGAVMYESNALNALDNAQDGPIITPCRGCSDYDGYGGCKSKGGCARAKMEVQDG